MSVKLLATSLLLIVGVSSAALFMSPRAAAVATNDVFNNSCQGYTVNADDPTSTSTPKPAACEDIARQQHCNDVKGTATACQSTNPIIAIIKTAISFIAKVLGAAAVIGIIVSGLRLILSNGDSNAIASARSGLVYCLVGVAIALLAQAIVSYVLKDVA